DGEDFDRCFLDVIKHPHFINSQPILRSAHSSETFDTTLADFCRPPRSINQRFNAKSAMVELEGGVCPTESPCSCSYDKNTISYEYAEESNLDHTRRRQPVVAERASDRRANAERQ